MKKITVLVDEETYVRAHRRASEQGITVSALVRAFLTQIVEAGGEGFDSRQHDQNVLIARIRATCPGFSAVDRLTRDQVHARYVDTGEPYAEGPAWCTGRLPRDE